MQLQVLVFYFYIDLLCFIKCDKVFIPIKIARSEFKPRISANCNTIKTHPNQEHAGLQLVVFQVQITWPKTRFKTTLSGKSEGSNQVPSSLMLISLCLNV